MQTQMEISAPEISQKVSWDQSSPGEWKEKTNSGRGAGVGGGWEIRLSCSLGRSLTPGGSEAGMAFYHCLQPVFGCGLP